MNFSAYWYSDTIVLNLYQDQLASSTHFIYRIVEELAHRTGTTMPKVYLINNAAPNAFATGRNPQNASIAVTTGLLKRLTKEEITGVLAHKLAYVVHRDTLISVVSATTAGAISGLANMLMWIPLSSHSSDGEEQRTHPIIAIIMMILAPIAAGPIQMAISRSREFEVDAGGAKICGNPLWLANALVN